MMEGGDNLKAFWLVCTGPLVGCFCDAILCSSIEYAFVESMCLTVRDCVFPDSQDKTIPAVLERCLMWCSILLFCTTCLEFKCGDVYFAVLFNWFFLNVITTLFW